jgi:hypothetical protein
MEALAAFPNTVGRCVNLCTYISERLKEDGVEHRVALGSLSCRGIKTFQYRTAFPLRPNRKISWEGHAWIEFPDASIGEPSLLRTAQTLPIGSNLRSHLDEIGILQRGAIMMSRQQQLEWALKYTKKQQLSNSAFAALIGGLMHLN